MNTLNEEVILFFKAKLDLAYQDVIDKDKQIQRLNKTMIEKNETIDELEKELAAIKNKLRINIEL